jgi:hypothetical protein
MGGSRRFLALCLITQCTPGSRAVDRTDAGSAGTEAVAPIPSMGGAAGSMAANRRLPTTEPFRAWPAPPPGPGVMVGAASEPAGPLRLVTGDAARAAVPDRCPDHDECHRIANNGADVAHASCDAQCDRCCPHGGVDDCVRRECTGACGRCEDDDCRGAVCNDAWRRGCHDRCVEEMSTCAGCRGVWCGKGAARMGCHRDVDKHHEATLRACDRDCPAGVKRADGSCSVTCGTTKTTTCSKSPGECANGQSPDCRCECQGAIAGACVAWTEVCRCD